MKLPFRQPLKISLRVRLNRDLQLLSRMDHIRILNDIAVGVKDRFPGQTVFLTDTGQVIAGFDGVSMTAATGCGIGPNRDIKDKVTGTILRVALVVLVPDLLFRFGTGCISLDVKNAVRLTEVIRRSVLVS